METISHAIMTDMILKSFAKELPEDISERIISGSIYLDAVQAVVGQEERSQLHLEKIPEDLSSEKRLLHKEDISLISSLFVSPNRALKQKDDIGCAERWGMYIHLLQDHLYDLWISEIVSEEIGDSGALIYYRLDSTEDREMRKDTCPQIFREDVYDLKFWSWQEGLRYLCEKITDKNFHHLSADTWIKNNIISRLEKSSIIEKEMLIYVLSGYRKVLLSHKNIPDSFKSHKEEIEENLHKTLDRASSPDFLISVAEERNL